MKLAISDRDNCVTLKSVDVYQGSNGVCWVQLRPDTLRFRPKVKLVGGSRPYIELLVEAADLDSLYERGIGKFRLHPTNSKELVMLRTCDWLFNSAKGVINLILLERVKFQEKSHHKQLQC